MSREWHSHVVGAAAALSTWGGAFAGGTLYFADIFVPDIQFDGSIRKVRTDGTGLDTILFTGRGLRSLDVDLGAGHIYWTDSDNFAIRRCDLDGGNVTDIITNGLIFPSAIDVEPSIGKMYWLDQDELIARADLDGSDYDLVRNSVTHRGVAIDAAAGKVYWSTSIDMFKGQIVRANLDGTQQELVVSSSDDRFKPSAIALDVAGGKIYWTDYTIDVVQRANLADGSDVELLFAVGANFNPRGIVLDLEEGKVYWGQDIDFDGTGGQIWRMDLNGDNQDVFMDGLGLVNYLALIPDEDGCAADFNGDGHLNLFDFLAYQSAFGNDDPGADLAPPFGVLNLFDFLAFQSAYGEGC